MPIRNFKPFEFPARKPGRRDIDRLHAALKKLRIKVPEDEVRRGEIGDATTDAVKEFQKRTDLTEDGVIGPKTIAALKLETSHAFFAHSKTRTAKLHEMLGRLDYKFDNDEAKGRLFGKTTEDALKDFQKKQGLTVDGRMNENVFEQLEKASLEARFRSPTQVAGLHRKLIRAIRIAKLQIQVDPKEVKNRAIGPTTGKAILAFQKKYQLNETGILDPETYERLESVAASQPSQVKLLRVRSAQNLAPVQRPLRLNMANKHVGELQKTLAFLGYKIAQKEFNTRTFGKTTRNAVLEFQRARGLPVNGHVEGNTLQALRSVILKANPAAVTEQQAYRVRGSVRDDLWRGKAGLKVQVWEKTLRGQGTLLAERKTLSDGFYDIPYEPPRNPVDGQAKNPLHLRICVLDAGGAELYAKILFNPTPIAWTNFTEGVDPYRGTSQYDTHMRAVTPLLEGVALKDMEESPAHQDITHLAVNSGLAAEDVVRLVLAHRAAENLGVARLGAEVFYAFFSQNLPPSLVTDLDVIKNRWAEIDTLVEQTVRDIVFMETELQAAAFDNASAENLIPIATVRNKQRVLDALAVKRRRFALEKPILVGNGSLKQVLDTSTVPPASHTKVAGALLAHGGLGKDFWTDVKARAGEFGGDDAVADLETTARLGEITKHHDETLVFLKNGLADPDFLKNTLGDPAQPTLIAASDFAKLDQGQWRTLIDANGGHVPADIQGNTPSKRKDAFAADLMMQSERLFPSIVLASEVDRGGQHGLAKLPEVRALLDAHSDLDLREANLDKFFADKGVPVDPAVLDEAKVLQRAHRLAPETKVGRALIEENLHHSAAIVFRGKERFADRLVAKGIDRRTAVTAFGYAEFQYAQVLQRLADFRFELHQANPKVIVQHTYSKEEQNDILGNVPNLETLFGAMDFCDCRHCASVFGPVAYLADVLRFLDAQPAEKQPYNTVLEVLLRRRPDIAKIKLNCENTDTPLPYIDLVCEILEGAVPAPRPATNFELQTTWKREELRAFPEHVRTKVYNRLRTAPFPMDASFDLWQEETRVWLEHLGVPRHKLMKTLQVRPVDGGARAPLDVSIAGEYFGISTHEISTITQAAPDAGAQQSFWGLDPTRAKIGVREFLNHTRLDDAKLEYRRLLELMQVKWITPVMLQRDPPASSCDLSLQWVVNLNLDLMDRIHRFLRIWRRTGWEMWQLDLLIRAPRIGNGAIDPSTLVRLYAFRRVQQAFKLPFETALALFYELNTELRTEPDGSTKNIYPLYVRLFQNRAVSDPVDPQLTVVSDPSDPNLAVSPANQLDGTEDLVAHKAALIAALGVTDADLTRLLERTDNTRTLANLTLIHNYLVVSRSLNLTVERILQLQDLAGVADIFASPKAMLDFIKLHERVKASRLQIDELDYLLNHRPESPHGLREEAIFRIIEGLRDSLRGASWAVDINTASKDELIPLPGIAEAKAQAIVDYREANGPFENVSDLINVPGIGPAILEDLIGLITVSSEENLSSRENDIVEKVAASYAMPTEQAKLLLTKVSLDDTLLSLLDEPRLVERDPSDARVFRFNISATEFPKIFEAIVLLHKTKILLERHSISSTKDLKWILDNYRTFELLGPGDLPVRVQPPVPLISKWVNLSKWLELRHRFPEPEEVSLRGIFDLSAKVDGAGEPQTAIADLHKAIHTLTKWSLKDLEALHGILKLKYDAAANDYARVETYMRLTKAMRAVNRLGVGADVAGTWALRDEDAGNKQAVTAQQAREAAKSKYDYPVWLDRASPLYDMIRERKRTALIRYLVEFSLRTEPATITVGGKDWRNPKYWEDANDLLRYFLIDVEMTSCQLTSRIKQAISSVQMFVQRCFLNLEQPYVQVSQDEREDTVSLNSWRQWRYMKSYRIAEAAKKKFLYPENWIEPELRDDKSPFFKELEAELLQGELTHDRAETSFRHYLEKLHEVSRLEIMGAYHEVDDDNPHDDLPPNIDLMHVIGRTKSDPAVYYYRRFDLNDGSWSAWEKIEVDITGDHLVPVVYNRKLHLFWLVFIEKPQKNKKQPPAKASTGPTNSPEPPKLLEIQLAWSERKEDGWTSKSLSREKLIHPWERPLNSYHLKPRYKSRENLLWLDLYISTSREFNETRFYDPFKHERHYMSAIRKFDESGRPWHSSSFLFDGAVVGLKMKPLSGAYHLIDGSGNMSDYASQTNSHEYVRRNFGDAGRAIDQLQGPYEIAPRLRLPDGMRYRYNRLTNNRVLANPTRLNVLEYGASRTLARGANAPFELAFSQSEIQFDTMEQGAEPILYQDPLRTFFIRPEVRTVLYWQQYPGTWRFFSNRKVESAKHMLGYSTVVQKTNYRFFPFYHPYSVFCLK
jgi:competence ComEA-like helix-hairpin-helix protein